MKLPKDDVEKLIRPVKCHLCGKDMYYSGDPKHVPEARVTMEFDAGEETIYVHASCWNKIFAVRWVLQQL